MKKLISIAFLSVISLVFLTGCESAEPYIQQTVDGSVSSETFTHSSEEGFDFETLDYSSPWNAASNWLISLQNDDLYVFMYSLSEKSLDRYNEKEILQDAFHEWRGGVIESDMELTGEVVDLGENNDGKKTSEVKTSTEVEDAITVIEENGEWKVDEY